MAAEEYLSQGGVGVSATSLWQSESGRKTLVVPRADLQTCALCHGTPEERPLASLLLGAVLVLPGLWHLALAAEGQAHFGLKSLRVESAVLLLLGIGLWLIWRSLAQRSYYLLVTGAGRPRKLVFKVKDGLKGVEAFLAEAEARFGLTCENRLIPGNRLRPDPRS